MGPRSTLSLHVHLKRSAGRTQKYSAALKAQVGHYTQALDPISRIDTARVCMQRSPHRLFGGKVALPAKGFNQSRVLENSAAAFRDTVPAQRDDVWMSDFCVWDTSVAERPVDTDAGEPWVGGACPRLLQGADRKRRLAFSGVQRQ